MKKLTTLLLLPILTCAMELKFEKGSPNPSIVDNPYRISNLVKAQAAGALPQPPATFVREDTEEKINPRTLIKKVSIDEEIDPEDFLKQFRDMRYFHLADKEMKDLLKTALEYALLNGHELYPKKEEDKKFYRDSDCTEALMVIIHRAQKKVATIIERTCAKNEFLENVQDISERIHERYLETFVNSQSPWIIKKSTSEVQFKPMTAALIYTILTCYDAMTGTSRKEMAYGTQLVARRLGNKIESYCFKDNAELPTFISLREKFIIVPSQEEAKKDKSADLKDLQKKQIKPDSKDSAAAKTPHTHCTA